jgi:hypothetical protein
MDSNFSDYQNLIKDYESFIGPLTDNSYPFQDQITYESFESPDSSLSGFYLRYNQNTGKSFVYGFYLFKSEEEKSNGVRVTIKGHYEVDINNQLLTLNIEDVYVCEPFGSFNSNDAQKISQILSENWKKIEIKNYHWFSRVLSIKQPVNIPENILEFEMYQQAEVEMKIDNGITLNPQILKILKKIERLKKGPIKTLSVTFVYQIFIQKHTIRLSLNPDGSLDFYHSTSEWDRDGDYSWDSSLSSKGQWVFDSENKTITLKFSEFKLLNNNEPIDFDSNFKAPADVVTCPFTFEDDTIKCIFAGWNMGKLEDFEEKTFQLVRYGEEVNF